MGTMYREVGGGAVEQGVWISLIVSPDPVFSLITPFTWEKNLFPQ